jgi:hypothetical protein
LQKAWYGDGPSWSLRGNGGFLSSVDRDVVTVLSSNNASEWSPHERNFVSLLFGGTVKMPPEAKGSIDITKVAGRYRLPSGRELELRIANGQLVTNAFAAPEVAMLVRPPNALATPKAKELEATAKAAFEQMVAGDTTLLQKTLIPEMPAKEEPAFWKKWMAEHEERHGKFVSVTPLWTVPVKDKEDLHTWVLMQFANRGVLVRWEQRANGTMAQAFPPRHLPDVYRFIPQGPAELVTWNAITGAAGSLRIEPDAVLLGGVRATRIAQ